MSRWAAAILLLTCCVSSATRANQRPNVLFIAVDDLRPQLNCYGKSYMHTPNLDALASRGVLFERAYCMVPTCGASRASLMTGIRPARDRFINYLTWADRDAPGVTTLNTHFKTHGYTTISLGKIFHHPDDSKAGWSETPWRSKLNDYKHRRANRQAIAKHRKAYPQRKKVRGLPFESADAADETYRDGETANRAVQYLSRFAKDTDAPFFLAVGFHKPHLPFTAPKKYWDLYDPQQIRLPENYAPPKDVPREALHTSGELRAYATIPPKGPVSDTTAKNLIHGYYACVSFIDAQVGKLLHHLDETGLAQNTIIVLWGDHGWQLGEHGMWNKHSCFETSMHAPLMIVAPENSAIEPGTRVRSLTEFIDIYPTLCELAAIPKPDHLQGTSLVEWMKDPRRPGKKFAIGRYRTGDTIRDDQFRYSEYLNLRGDLTGEMLFDHRSDPSETKNVTESNPDVSEALRSNLRAHKGR